MIEDPDRQPACSDRRVAHLRVAVICDQTVDLHFPPHFNAVYLELLPKRGLEIKTGAFVRDKRSRAAQDFLSFKNVRLFSKRSTTLLGRLALAAGIPWLIRRWFRDANLRNVDVVLVHNDPVIAWTAWLLTRRRRTAFVYRITHLIPESIMATGGVGRRIVGRLAVRARDALLRRSDAVVPMSQAMANRFAARLDLAHEVMKPVESTVRVDGVPAAGDPSCSAVYARVRDELEKKSCTRWLVYVGTLDPQRRPWFLLDTLNTLRWRDSSVGLLVLGVTRSASHLAALRGYARERGLDEFVVWSEPVPDDCLPVVLSLTDVGLSPFPVDEILSTNSPVKTLEYIRGGIPVVASPIPDNVFVLNESGGGVVVDNNAEAFAAAAYSLLEENSAQRRRRSEAAIEWLRVNRDLEVSTNKLYDVLHNARRRSSER